MTAPRRDPYIGTAAEIEPDLERLVSAVALLYLEVEAGRRPARQIQRLVSPAVYERLLVRPQQPRRDACGPTARAIRAVRTSSPGPDAVEASVVVVHRHRVRALAIRMERHLGRWRVVEVSRPEDREPPRRTASLAGPVRPRGTA